MDLSKKASAPVHLEAGLPDLKLTIDNGNKQEKEDAIRLLRQRSVGPRIAVAVLLLHLLANVVKAPPFSSLQYYVIPAVVLLIWLESRNTNRRIEALIVHLGISDRLGIIDGTRAEAEKES